MHSASFRFYANLNDFLPSEQKQLSYQYRFRGKPGIKDAIEALGPPHTEIDLILVNAQPVGFEYALQDGDRVLLKRGSVRYGYCVRGTNPREQLDEVVSYYDLVGAIKPFRRCMRCNGKLHSVVNEAIIDQLPPGVHERHTIFHRCAQCGRVYWRGTHVEGMQRLIESVRVRCDR